MLVWAIVCFVVSVLWPLLILVLTLGTCLVLQSNDLTRLNMRGTEEWGGEGREGEEESGGPNPAPREIECRPGRHSCTNGAIL